MKCFIDTVSPARSSVRSKTVCARTVRALSVSVGTLKRHDSIPRFQPELTNAMSGPVFGSFTRADTK